jgi:UDP-N-acetylmuramate: L-alanyl-gamma-D-glutamyl-meso-diaminopimelate ligase
MASVVVSAANAAHTRFTPFGRIGLSCRLSAGFVCRAAFRPDLFVVPPFGRICLSCRLSAGFVCRAAFRRDLFVVPPFGETCVPLNLATLNHAQIFLACRLSVDSITTGKNYGAIHILGICGTFMGGLAVLARAMGLAVSGSDQNVYPPMSTQLTALGIALKSGYCAENLTPVCDTILIGNALSRGNAEVEAVLNQRLNYQSGPAWLARVVLSQHRVLAVAGTHGKTTTTSLLAWILQCAELEPGFLVGGVPRNFGVSARLSPALAAGLALGNQPPFVIEADEYDTAFFDKRSKFVHYRPEIAILNNLEFDHADIFPDLAAIEKQFHHLVRTVPGNGTLVVNADDANLARVLTMGCYSHVKQFSTHNKFAEYFAEALNPEASRFAIFHHQRLLGEVQWNLCGAHNLSNALAAVAAACAYGVDPIKALSALGSFDPPKRRMEHLGRVNEISVYDDFAHHPTAIATTLAGLRAKLGTGRIHAVLEPRSNTMRLGSHAHELAPALAAADHVWLLRRPELPWNAEAALASLGNKAEILPSSDAILAGLKTALKPGDTVLFMSNGGFDAIQKRLLEQLAGADLSGINSF